MVQPTGTNKRNNRTEGKACIIHGKCNYTTNNYKKAKELGLATNNTQEKRSFSKRCYKRDAPSTRDHPAVCLKRDNPANIISTRAIRFLRITDRINDGTEAEASKYNPANNTNYDDESILIGDEVVNDIQHYSSLCKLQPLNKKNHSFLNKRTELVFVPITIENCHS